jgi:hypothetical protein
MTREITIQPVLNGYICKVGCQIVVFQGRSQLIEELGKYLNDPEGTERSYVANAVNKMSDVPQPCPPPSVYSSLPQTPMNTIAAGQGQSLGTLR